MSQKAIQTLTGFRDFAPRDCAIRNYLFETWRGVAHRYGFVEYETPILEDTELYLRKSGDELPTQLFRFEDQGGRDVTLRPEVTASLGRLAARVQREFPKPMKWFEIGQCFRYEKPQKGRGREFYQFNVDVLGEASAAADAELVAFAIDCMRALGFTADDFKLRLSDRQAWLDFCDENDISDSAVLLGIVDKMERTADDKVAEQLAAIGLSREALDAFIARGESEALALVQADLGARGLLDYIEIDLSIVRGLAYYTGVVFEIFDTQKSLRAIAGGGRYDTLLKTVGGFDMPATGFAMGDMVIRHLIEENTLALAQMEAWLDRQSACDLYIVVADEEQRPNALRILNQLRSEGIRCDYAMKKAKFDKQLKAAINSGAKLALIIGSEFPEMQLKDLVGQTQSSLAPNVDLVSRIKDALGSAGGPLLA